MAIKKFIENHRNEEELNLYGKSKSLIGIVASGIPDLGKTIENIWFRKSRHQADESHP